MAQIITVGQLTRHIGNLVNADALLADVAVQGEISNYKQYPSGHCYFALKDKEAVLPCVMFRGNAQRMRFKPENGMQVIASGAVSVYTEGGKYQLYVKNMAPDGVGQLAAAFEQLKEKLRAEGLFEEAHKKPLPLYPVKIGIVTSSAGAVLRDIYRVSKSRFPGVQLALRPVQVQGEGAAEQIVAAIDFFNKKYPVDVLIVGRGGGSMEDLWAFNEEAVVRAIYRSQIPVISAVGHETDFTLADFAADKRAATPSQAAEFAVRDVREIQREIANLQARLTAGAKGRLMTDRLRLARLMDSRVFTQPETLLHTHRQRLDMLQGRLLAVGENRLQAYRHRLELLTGKLELLNPMHTLRKGYGLVQGQSGRLISSIQQVNKGEILNIRVSDGTIQAQITDKQEG